MTKRPRLKMLDYRTVKTLDPRTAKPLPTPREKGFYQSKEWRRLSEAVKEERGRRCQDPKCETPRGPWDTLVCDHIVEMVDGGAELDRSNLMVRCAEDLTANVIVGRSVTHRPTIGFARHHSYGRAVTVDKIA